MADETATYITLLLSKSLLEIFEVDSTHTWNNLTKKSDEEVGTT